MDKHIVTNRRREVEQEIARHEQALAELKAEMADLDTTLRVLDRLSGAQRPQARSADEPKPPVAPSEKPGDVPSMTVMIVTVLREGYRRGLKGMEPKEITEAIREKWGKPVNPDYVRTKTWRLMKNEKLLVKLPGTALYTLPRNDEGSDVGCPSLHEWG